MDRFVDQCFIHLFEAKEKIYLINLVSFFPYISYVSYVPFFRIIFYLVFRNIININNIKIFTRYDLHLTNYICI